MMARKNYLKLQNGINIERNQTQKRAHLHLGDTGYVSLQQLYKCMLHGQILNCLLSQKELYMVIEVSMIVEQLQLSAQQSNRIIKRSECKDLVKSGLRMSNAGCFQKREPEGNTDITDPWDIKHHHKPE